MKRENAITLIALIITIVVLIIISAVSIKEVTGNGILNNAKKVSTEYIKEQEMEELNKVVLESEMEINDSNPLITKIFSKLETKKDELKLTVEQDTNTQSLKVTFSNSSNIYKIDENGNITFIENSESGFDINTAQKELIEVTDSNNRVPAYNYYTSFLSARGIKALKAYNGKIFMGLGDWDANTGAAKIIYYDTSDTENKIKSSGTILDEAVENFTEIDGTLYTTGCDPTESWGIGSIYSYDNSTNKWIQHKYAGESGTSNGSTIYSGWVHIFNIKQFNNKTFLCGEVYNYSSISTKYSFIQYSTDNNVTFNNVNILYNTTNLTYKPDLRSRNLYICNGNLYTFITDSSSNQVNAQYNGIYKYDESSNTFNYYSSFPTFAYTSNTPDLLNWRSYCRGECNLFNNNLLYISGRGLYKTNDMKNFSLVSTGNNDIIQNTITVDGTLYALAYVYNSDYSFTTRIYRTSDLTIFNKIYEFTVDTPPYSFEYYDNSFYIGTAYGDLVTCKDSSKNGSLYRIKLN